MTSDADSKRNYVLCIDAGDYPASLEVRKIYELHADPEAEKQGLVRVVDESGEDYLYPSQLFVAIDLSEQVQEAIKTSV